MYFTMLTKSDLKSIDQLLDKRLSVKLKEELTPIRKDISVLKTDVSVLKTDVATLKSNVAAVRTDVAVLKTDVAFTKNAVMSLLEESQDIHETLVKEKLPERVHRLEHIVHVTA